MSLTIGTRLGHYDVTTLIHPNIAAVHGIEEDEVEGRRALVPVP